MSKIKGNFKKKTIVLITLFTISTIIFLNFQVKDAKALPSPQYIPIINQHNKWHWHEDVQNGTEYIYETKIIAQNKTTGEYMFLIKNYFIFNISISNATIEWQGKPCFFSVINATELYYDNSLGKTVAYPMTPGTIGGFQYNDTYYPAEPKERIFANEMIRLPVFLPINGSDGESINNDITILADIINRTLFYPQYWYGMYNFHFPFMNLWNDVSFPSTNTILFENDSGYYCQLEYFQNGTLKYGELYAELLMTDPQMDHPEGLAIVNWTFNRIFDPNPINEVQWGVEEGDIIYFGENSGDYSAGEDYSEVYWNVSGIANFTTDDADYQDFTFTYLYEGDAYITFQELLIDVYLWNRETKQYEFDTTYKYGWATDYMPYINDKGGYILPNNTNIEDLTFCGDQWSLYGEGMQDFGGGPITIKDENGYYKTYTSMAMGNFTWKVWYDKNSGLPHLWFYNVKDEKYYGKKNWESLFIKENHTINDGKNVITLNSRMLNNVNATVNISASTGGDPFTFIVGLVPDSPVNETLPYGTPLVFVDWLISNTGEMVLKYINITIELPSSLDLAAINIQLWIWNETDHQYDWTIPSDISDALIFNYAENSITIKIPLDSPQIRAFIAELIFAISYTIKPSVPSGDDDDDDDGEEPAAIPGFDLWVIFGLIALISLITILKKRKFVV